MIPSYSPRITTRQDRRSPEDRLWTRTRRGRRSHRRSPRMGLDGVEVETRRSPRGSPRMGLYGVEVATRRPSLERRLDGAEDHPEDHRRMTPRTGLRRRLDGTEDHLQDHQDHHRTTTRQDRRSPRRSLPNDDSAWPSIISDGTAEGSLYPCVYYNHYSGAPSMTGHAHAYYMQDVIPS